MARKPRKASKHGTDSAGAKPSRGRPPRSPKSSPIELRIIGGSWRGSKLLYNGDPATRPMKDRTREAIFNLVGPGIKGMHALDLFAGTGALGLEAISRGATRATFFERNMPAVRTLKDNIARFQVEPQTEILFGNTFFHAEKFTFPADQPCLIFVSPPYDFFVERAEEMQRLIASCCQRVGPESMVVVEADARFDAAALPDWQLWDTRSYRPAMVSIRRL